jgi:phenol hydroxylase P2 protein
MTQVNSITLLQNDDARPIIDAILTDNEDVRVVNMPGVVKLDRNGPIVVNRASVEERIGRPWDLQELQLSLVSITGYLDEDDDHFIIKWGNNR